MVVAPEGLGVGARGSRFVPCRNGDILATYHQVMNRVQVDELTITTPHVFNRSIRRAGVEPDVHTTTKLIPHHHEY